MGSLLEHRMPAQLLWIIGASSALVSISFVEMAWYRSKSPQPIVWCSFAALLLGFVICLLAERALQNGINSERKLTAHPAFSVLSGLLFIGALAYVAFCVGHRGGVWMILWPQMSLTRVRSYLRPKPKSDRLLRPRERPKPLQSENWGTPPRPFTN